MEKTLKVGDKAKGFLFANKTDDVCWAAEMTEYIGQEGKIIYIGSDYFHIHFGDTSWLYPTSLMHLAVVEEQPKVIEIDMSKVENVEYLVGGIWKESINKYYPSMYRFTMKDENKLKIEQEIEDLENKIKELKKQL